MKTNDENKWHRPEIMNIDQKDLVYGQIYIIKCIKSNKNYVGQVVSHRKNKNKYRLFGIDGRFKDHLSEAICNTKKKQCRYLNSAIRKYGKNQFIVELLENCELSKMNELEIYYINFFNTLAPNGYNLSVGGKKCVNLDTIEDHEKIKLNHKSNKRGREFGYTHKSATINKMKIRHAEESKEDKKKREKKMRETMSTYYKNKRVNLLLGLGIQFDENFFNYIRPKKKDNEIVGYVIRINRRERCKITNKNATIKEKYDLLYEALESAYKVQQEGKK